MFQNCDVCNVRYFGHTYFIYNHSKLKLYDYFEINSDALHIEF